MACKASGENRDSIEIKKEQASNSGSLFNQVTRPGLASPIQKRFALPKGLPRFAEPALLFVRFAEQARRAGK